MCWRNLTNYSSVSWEKRSSQVWNWGNPKFLKMCYFNSDHNHRKNKNNDYHLLNLTYKSRNNGYKRFLRGCYWNSTTNTPKLVAESTIINSLVWRQTNILLRAVQEMFLKNLTEHSRREMFRMKTSHKWIMSKGPEQGRKKAEAENSGISLPS